MRNKMYKFAVILAISFSLFKIICLFNNLLTDTVYAVKDNFKIEEIDIDTYAELYYEEHGKSLKDVDLNQNIISQSNTMKIAPVKLMVTKKIDGISVVYGCYVLVMRNNEEMKQFVEDSICGDFVNIDSSIWNFNEYFVNSILLNDTTIALAIRGNFMINWGEHVMVSKKPFTDTYRCNLSHVLE